MKCDHHLKVGCTEAVISNPRHDHRTTYSEPEPPSIILTPISGSIAALDPLSQEHPTFNIQDGTTSESGAAQACRLTCRGLRVDVVHLATLPRDSRAR